MWQIPYTLVVKRANSILQELLNIKFVSLKFDSIEDGWNNFRKIISKVAVGVLGKKVWTAARNISEETFMFNRVDKGLVQALSV